MNKQNLSVAVAAVYGASMAKAQCQSALPLPDQTQSDKMALAEQNHAYMDACVEDGKVSYTEFEALIADIGEGGTNRAENVRKFQLMDLNNDNEISVRELLEYYRIKYNPINVGADLPPFSMDTHQLFNYMKCPPKPSTEDQDCTSQGYTRETLKAVLPIILPLGNIINDHVSYEAYVSHEFALRDRNQDGIVDREEKDRNDWHYKFIRGFWNHSKGAGNERRTIPDDGVMDFETWNKQDNMMVKRDYPNSDIPDQELVDRFNGFDKNRNNELSWWEYWSTIQQADIGWNRQRELFEQIEGPEQEADRVITRDELTAYYNSLNVDGSLVDLEIEAQVEAFLDTYDSDKDGRVEFWEMWMRKVGEIDREQRSRRATEQATLKFDQHTWYTCDENRDRQLTYDEIIGFGQKSTAQADELYALVGKDPTQEVLTYDEVRAAYSTVNYMTVEGFRSGWRGFTQGLPLDIASQDTSSEQLIKGFRVESQEELDALLAALDVDANGEIDELEACRHFVSSVTMICELPEYAPMVDPDYAE